MLENNRYCYFYIDSDPSRSPLAEPSAKECLLFDLNNHRWSSEEQYIFFNIAGDISLKMKTTCLDLQ